MPSLEEQVAQAAGDEREQLAIAGRIAQEYLALLGGRLALLQRRLGGVQEVDGHTHHVAEARDVLQRTRKALA